MAKLTHIRGCGPMVCSDYREVSAAIDRAHAGPRHEPMRWSSVTAQLEAGVAREANPLADPLTLKIDSFGPADNVPQLPER